MLRENLNEIKSLGIELKKNKSIKKIIKKITIKRIDTKLDIKINEKKCSGMELKKNKSIKKMIENKKQQQLKK